MKILLLSLSGALLFSACSGASKSRFSGTPNSGQVSTQQSAAAESAPAPATSASEPTLQPEPAATPLTEKSQECWFAVSGTYVGLGDYEDTFPKTKSGNKIATGEIFDTVGGVFGSQTTFKEKFDSGGLKHWPQWMQDYLKETLGQVKIIGTHSGRWVKVSVVDGGQCSNSGI